MATTSVRWRVAGAAEPLLFDRDDVSLRSSVAAAPGAPLDGVYEAPGGGPMPIIVKVRRCRLEPAGSFRIDGRLVNPTRALREALARHVGAPAAAGGEAPAAGGTGAASGEAPAAKGEAAGGAAAGPAGGPRPPPR